METEISVRVDPYEVLYNMREREQVELFIRRVESLALKMDGTPFGIKE